MKKPEGLGAPPKAGQGNKIGVLGRASTGKTELVMSGCHKDKGCKLGLIFDTEGRTQWRPFPQLSRLIDFRRPFFTASSH